MSKLIGSSTISLVDAAQGKMDVVKIAVDSLRDLARQPYKLSEPAPQKPAKSTSGEQQTSG
jgi:hypothetical protein